MTKKTYIVETLDKGTKEIRADAERFAWRAAIARGWKPIEVYEKKEMKKAA